MILPSSFEEAAAGKEHAVPVEELKALFYVRTFEGSKGYEEKKVYRPGKKPGRKVFIKFRDGEKLVGFLEADVAPDKVISFLKSGGNKKGFFLVPVDAECNNTRIFAAWNAIDPFSKWAKKVEPVDLAVVKEYYGYSDAKALEALRILTPDQIDSLRKELDKGE